MKFRFKNLGPIKEAALELGDLTVIAGRNNTGKPYLAYALYGFLKRWEWWPEAGSFLDAQALTSRHSEVRNLLRGVARSGHVERAIDPRTIAQEREAVMKVLTRAFSEAGLARVFSSPRTTFEDAEITVEIPSPFLPDLTPFELRSSSRRHRVYYRDNNIRVSVDPPPTETIDEAESLPVLTCLYLFFLFPELRINPFLLSSERIGISLFYRELDFTKNHLLIWFKRCGTRVTRASRIYLSSWI